MRTSAAKFYFHHFDVCLRVPEDIFTRKKTQLSIPSW